MAKQDQKLKIILLLVACFGFFVLTNRVQAATYYIKPSVQGGRNSNVCTNHAEACATFSGVAAKNPAAGSDVYFLAGGAWTGDDAMALPNWSGTAADPSVIGAYSWNGSGEVLATDTASITKPVLDGLNTSNASGGIITIGNRNYWTIQHLDVRNAANSGIFAYNATMVNIRYARVFNTYNGGIIFGQGNESAMQPVNGGSIEHTTIERAGITVLANGGVGPANLAFVWGSNNVDVNYCKIINGYGEGFGSYNLSHHITLQNSIIYGNRRVMIYLDAGHDFTIKNNLLYATTDVSGNKNPDGIGIVIESWHPDRAPWNTIENVLITGNIVHAGNRSFYWNGQNPDMMFRNIRVYNNTFVDPGADVAAVLYKTNFWGASDRSQIGLPGDSNYEPAYVAHFDGFYIQNNIAVCYNAECIQGSMPTKLGMTWSHNSYFGNLGTKDTDQTGVGDISANPLLAKTSGWYSLIGGQLTGQEYSISLVSPAKNAGVDLGDAYDDGLDLDESNWNSSTFANADRDPDWEIGADVALESDTVAPSVPDGLSVR